MAASTPRDRILASAIDLLDREGATALTVRNVAAGAGYSTTGVYTHFGGKQGLVDAIFIDGFDSFDTALDEGDGDLRALVGAYRTWALAKPTHYLVMFGRAVPEYRPSDQGLVRAGHVFDRLVERVGAYTGIAGDRGRDVAFHVWATVHGYVMLEMLNMFPPSLGSPADLYTAGVTAMMEGLPQPAA